MESSNHGHKNSREIVINKDSLPIIFCILLFAGLGTLGFFFNKVKAENKYLHSEVTNRDQIITDLNNKISDVEVSKSTIEKQKNETETKLSQTETEKKEIQKKVETSEKSVLSAQKELSQTNKELSETQEEKETCYIAADYLIDIATELETIFLGIDSAYTEYISFVHGSYTFDDIDSINAEFNTLTSRVSRYNTQYEKILSDLNSN